MAKLLVNEKGEWVIGEYYTYENVEYFKLYGSSKPIIDTDEFRYKTLYSTFEEIKRNFVLKTGQIISDIEFNTEKTGIVLTIIDFKGNPSILDSRTSNISFKLNSSSLDVMPTKRGVKYISPLTGEFSLDWNFIFNYKEKRKHEEF